jgi:predicted DNA-binding antitoxin AbrB/MazE fold protein
MIAHVKARFSNGTLVPLEPLDLEEGKEVVVSIEDVGAPDAEAPSLLEMIDELHGSVPQNVWGNGPSDGAKNYKHYLYGRPRDDTP